MIRKTHLRFAGLQRRSIAAYRIGLERFLAFISKRRISVRSSRHLDENLAEYLNCMYQEGEPVSAADTLSGIKHFIPELKMKLPCASQKLAEVSPTAESTSQLGTFASDGVGVLGTGQSKNSLASLCGLQLPAAHF